MVITGPRTVKCFVDDVDILEFLCLLVLVVLTADFVEVEHQGQVEAATVVSRRISVRIDVEHVGDLIMQRLIIVNAQVIHVYCEQITAGRVVAQLVQHS